MINVFSDSSLRGHSVIYQSNCSRGKGNYSGFSNLLDMGFELALTLILCCAVLSHSVVSDSLPTPCSVALQAPVSIGILQARTLEWVAMFSSRGSSQPRERTQVSHIAGEFLPSEPLGKPDTGIRRPKMLSWSSS